MILKSFAMCLLSVLTVYHHSRFELFPAFQLSLFYALKNVPHCGHLNSIKIRIILPLFLAHVLSHRMPNLNVHGQKKTTKKLIGVLC